MNEQTSERREVYVTQSDLRNALNVGFEGLANLMEEELKLIELRIQNNTMKELAELSSRVFTCARRYAELKKMVLYHRKVKQRRT